MPSLFYIRLISFTAGTLVYLFLLALILGHRRPRLFERLLFFVGLSMFLIYASGLLEINAMVEYGTPPAVTRWSYTLLRGLGFAFLPGLLVQLHTAYLKSVRGRRVSKWLDAMAWLFYLAPFAILTFAVVWGGAVPPVTFFDGFDLLPSIDSVLLIPALFVVIRSVVRSPHVGRLRGGENFCRGLRDLRDLAGLIMSAHGDACRAGKTG